MSSDEEDISDEEITAILNAETLRKPRTIRLRPNHFHVFGDSEFYERFRMSKRSAYSILDLIGQHIKNPTNWSIYIHTYIYNICMYIKKIFKTKYFQEPFYNRREYVTNHIKSLRNRRDA